MLTNNNGAVVSLDDGFSYLADTDIHAIVPNVGQYATQVAIGRVNLLSGASELASLTLAVPLIRLELPLIRLIVAATDTAVIGDVVLDAGNGATVERADEWTYVAPANIADVSPANGMHSCLSAELTCRRRPSWRLLLVWLQRPYRRTTLALRLSLQS